jgi:hypothetical protein
MLKAVFQEALKQWDKRINSTRYMGELWQAERIKKYTIHKRIYMLLKGADDLSMKCL